MERMFENVRIGDKVWCYLYGWGRVVGIGNISDYPIEVEFIDKYKHIHIYTYEGKIAKMHDRPTLFWDEIKIEIPKRPFNLVSFLKNNLTPAKFVYGEWSTVLIFSDSWYLRSISDSMCIGAVYFEDLSRDEIQTIVDTLNKEAVTVDEVIEAFKTLEWL